MFLHFLFSLVEKGLKVEITIYLGFCYLRNDYFGHNQKELTQAWLILKIWNGDKWHWAITWCFDRACALLRITMLSMSVVPFIGPRLQTLFGCFGYPYFQIVSPSQHKLIADAAYHMRSTCHMGHPLHCLTHFMAFSFVEALGPIEWGIVFHNIIANTAKEVFCWIFVAILHA